MESKAPLSEFMDEEHYNILYLEQLYFLKNGARILSFREHTFVRYTSWQTRTVHSLIFSAHLCSFIPFHSDIPKA